MRAAGADALEVDVTDQASVDALAAGLDSADVLVNVAGGEFGGDPVGTADPADWQRMFELNVLGTLRMTRALLPLLEVGAGGTIVNLTSTAASVNYEGGGGYSAANARSGSTLAALRAGSQQASAPERIRPMTSRANPSARATRA